MNRAPLVVLCTEVGGIQQLGFCCSQPPSNVLSAVSPCPLHLSIAQLRTQIYKHTINLCVHAQMGKEYIFLMDNIPIEELALQVMMSWRRKQGCNQGYNSVTFTVVLHKLEGDCSSTEPSLLRQTPHAFQNLGKSGF